MLFSSLCFVRQHQQVAGTRHTQCPSFKCYIHPVCGPLLCWQPSVRKVNRKWTHCLFYTNRHRHAHRSAHVHAVNKKYTVKKLKSIISHFSRLSLSVNLSHCCCEGHLSLASVAIVTQGNNCWNYSKSIYDKNISSTMCSNTLLTLLHCARKFYMSGPANEVISVSLF